MTPQNGALVAIVDNDASVCRALERLVRSLGYTGQTFSRGDDFLDTLASLPSFRPDCVVLDMHMPGLSGLEVQQRLAHTALPVIFITAHDEPGLRKKVISAGAVALLRKPFDHELFIQTLHGRCRVRAIDNPFRSRQERSPPAQFCWRWWPCLCRCFLRTALRRRRNPCSG